MRTRKTDEGQQSFVSIFFEWVGFSYPKITQINIELSQYQDTTVKEKQRAVSSMRVTDSKDGSADRPLQGLHK
ncbi:hypothetical protein EBR57_03745 [bacterium]|nr:hypothetical protein [bacterium]